MVNTVWSVSCSLFFYHGAPVPSFVKVGARAPVPHGVWATDKKSPEKAKTVNNNDIKHQRETKYKQKVTSKLHKSSHKDYE